MPISSIRSLPTRTSVALALLAIACFVGGCTETESDAPPEEHHGPPHSIMEVGSTESGGGMLVVNAVPTAFVVASACLGGTGDECTGGIVAYTGDSPGFNDVRTEDAGPIKLPDGVEVSIEITAVDPDASVLISGTLLDTVGETTVVNTSPELHNHPTWQIVAPGGTVPEDKTISFRLHAEGYDSSDEITVTVAVFEEGNDHEPGEDDD